MPESIDLAKVKRNVAKMVSMNAPESDIDEYISSENTSIDAIKNFNEDKVLPKISQEEANRYVSRAEFNASGINPYVNAMAKSAREIMPIAVGGAVSSSLIKPGASIIKTMIAGSAGGATTGILSPAEDIIKRSINTITGAGIGALLPAAAAGIGKGFNFVKSFPGAMEQIKTNIKNIKDPATFGKQVREALFEAKKAVGQTIGKELDDLAKLNPNKTIDLSNDFGRLNSALNDVENNPGLSAQVKSILNRVRNPDDAAMIKKFIDNPSQANSVSLADSQKLKLAIQNAPDIATKLSKGKFADYTSADLEILDLLDNVKMSQSSVFPELAKIRRPYADFMRNYDQVKTMFGQKQLLNKIRSGFGNEEIDKIINTILPEKTLKNISGFRSAEKAVRLGKKAGGLTAAGLAGAKAIDYIGDAIRK